MMGTVLHFVRRRGPALLLFVSAGHLFWLACVAGSSKSSVEPGEVPYLRNNDFPSTYVGRIHLDLTSPSHWVRLTWIGPEAASQNSGPFRSSPGAGWGTNNCNDPVESNCANSLCTPKGIRKVEGFMDHLKNRPEYRYVTLIDKGRAIGFHAHPSVPSYPASKGCVRLEPYAARLIHDNSIVGVTEIVIDGTWTNPHSPAGE